MTRKPLSSLDLLPELIAGVVVYGLSTGRDMVITMDADYTWWVYGK